ncbi:hypothetical protein BB560_000928 [Smittium megazygosporum]|uniref:Alkaline phosphatase n=1 Tax=Smittium megazygosporum TaxID=133381 RepID=A0A2T9ZJ16_9FUNG|nr:hypothetical protein BB560_000928 [Smittium megazygosporum]
MSHDHKVVSFQLPLEDSPDAFLRNEYSYKQVHQHATLRAPPSSVSPRIWRFFKYPYPHSLYAIAYHFSLFIALSIIPQTSSTSNINVILMVSDGFGPASETMARQFKHTIHKLPVSWQSPLDKILVGSSRTQSSDSLVTDSAAGATAFACGLKSYNGAIGVDPKGRPCGTILEAAKLQGMLTGMVVTSRITHATPGSFSSHVVFRDMEDLIAEYQIGNYTLGSTVDLIFGGGKCFFLPNTDPETCRSDDRDLWKEAISSGFTTFSSLSEFNSLNNSTRLPVLGLFTRSHMNYEIDRNPSEQPSLAEMTKKALEILDYKSKSKDAGFFLMVEGSRIDMAAHQNDPSTHVREIIAYWDAVQVVRNYIKQNPNTVVISVSDHETGGISVARQISEKYPDYTWKPHVLARVTKSNELITSALLAFTMSNSHPGSFMQQKKEFVRHTVLSTWMGVNDYTEEDVDRLATYQDYGRIQQCLSDIISKRALIGWATHGHSSVDVNLYVSGYNSQKLRGNVENIEIGHFIKNTLNLDLDKVTKLISKERTEQKYKSSSSKLPDILQKLYYDHN